MVISERNPICVSIPWYKDDKVIIIYSITGTVSWYFYLIIYSTKGTVSWYLYLIIYSIKGTVSWYFYLLIYSTVLKELCRDIVTF